MIDNIIYTTDDGMGRTQTLMCVIRKKLPGKCPEGTPEHRMETVYRDDNCRVFVVHYYGEYDESVHNYLN